MNAIHIVTSLMIISTSCLFAMDRENQPLKPMIRRLIMLMDPQNTEGIDPSKHGFLTAKLEMALLQESAPILVTKKLAAQIISLKIRALDQTFGAGRLPGEVEDTQILLNEYKKILSAESKPANIDEELARRNVRTTDSNIATWYQVPLFSQSYYLFDCQNTNLILFIPKKYVVAVLGRENLNQSADEREQLGFVFGRLKEIALPSYQGLILDSEQKIQLAQAYKVVLSNIEAKPDIFTYQDITNLFVRNSGAWNIYWSGHGLKERRDKNGVIKQKTQIAGLLIDDFKPILSFCNSEIQTFFLYYTTCFGGRDHLDFPYKDFGTKMKYIIAVGAVSDSEVSEIYQIAALGGSSLILKNGKIITKPTVDYVSFFAALENRDSFDLRNVLKNVTNFSVDVRSLPHIRFPGTEYFSVTDIDTSVLIVTKVKNYQKTVDGLIFDGSNKKAIVIVPSVMTVPLRVRHEEARGGQMFKPIEFVFLAPDKKHFLSEIQIDNLNQFVRSDLMGKFAGAQYAVRPSLFIKKISLLDDKRFTIITSNGAHLDSSTLANVFINLQDGTTWFLMPSGEYTQLEIRMMRGRELEGSGNEVNVKESEQITSLKNRINGTKEEKEAIDGQLKRADSWTPEKRKQVEAKNGGPEAFQKIINEMKQEQADLAQKLGQLEQELAQELDNSKKVETEEQKNLRNQFDAFIAQEQEILNQAAGMSKMLQSKMKRTKN